MPRIRAIRRPKRPEAAICSSCTVDAGTGDGAESIGIGTLASSRPCFVKTTRRPVTWHFEQLESVVLDARDNPHHIRQDQLSAARCTTHRHAHHAPTPRLVAYRSGSRSIAVICYAVDNARIHSGAPEGWARFAANMEGRAPCRLRCNSSETAAASAAYP